MLRRLFWGLSFILTALVAVGAATPLDLKLRHLVRSEHVPDHWESVESRAQWAPAGTAAVICDMWDKHWCQGASARVGEMAPRMNQLISTLRERGVLIIHCPSETMKF